MSSGNKTINFRINKAGLTIIELLVVIGIFAIFLSGGLFLNIDSFKSYYFYAEEKMINSLLRVARNRAVSNINHVSHGLFISDNDLVLFRGENYDENSPFNEDFRRNESVQVENGFANQSVIFENLSGKPRQIGEIRIFDNQR